MLGTGIETRMTHVNETKKCKGCGEYKPLESFHHKKGSKDGRQTRCKPCNQASVEEWQKNNQKQFQEGWKRRATESDYSLKRKLTKYRLSLEDYNKLLEDCDNKCTICRREVVKWLDIDHCHLTGVVRGLLCNKCNTGLGLFQDDPVLLQNAIKYLENAPLAESG